MDEMILGVLNPLDCPHHLRASDLSVPYREGIVLEKPVKKGRGPLCNIGLFKVCWSILSSFVHFACCPSVSCGFS